MMDDVSGQQPAQDDQNSKFRTYTCLATLSALFVGISVSYLLMFAATLFFLVFAVLAIKNRPIRTRS